MVLWFQWSSLPFFQLLSIIYIRNSSQLFPKHSNTRSILLIYFSGKIFPRPFAVKISDSTLFLVFSCHSEILRYQFLRDSIYLHHDDSPVTQIFGFPLYWFSIWRTISFISFLRKGIGVVHETYLFSALHLIVLTQYRIMC